MAAWTNKPKIQFLCFSLIIKQDLKHMLQKMFHVSFYLTKLFQVCVLKLSRNISVISCIFRAWNGQWLLHRSHQHLGLLGPSWLKAHQKNLGWGFYFHSDCSDTLVHSFLISSTSIPFSNYILYGKDLMGLFFFSFSWDTVILAKKRAIEDFVE